MRPRPRPPARPSVPPPAAAPAPLPTAAPRGFWSGPFGFVLTGAVCFALGSFTTWRFLRDDLEFARRGGGIPAAAPSAGASVPGSLPSDTGSGLPDAEGSVVRGNTFYDQRRWADAAREYERALAAGVNNADVRTDLANCYRFLDQPDRAIELYRAAHLMDPRHENSLFNLGTLYQLVLRDRAKAIETLRLFVARFPTGANTANARAALAQLEASPPAPAGSPAPPVATATNAAVAPNSAVPAPVTAAPTPAVSVPPTPPPAASAVPPVAPVSPVPVTSIPPARPASVTPSPPPPTSTAPPTAPAGDAVRDWLERRAAPSSSPGK